MVLRFPDYNSILGKFRKVVFVEGFLETLTAVHEKELLHAGYKKNDER